MLILVESIKCRLHLIGHLSTYMDIMNYGVKNIVKNIILLTSTLGDGGAQKVVSVLSRLFNNNDYNVYVLVFDGQDIEYNYEGTLIDLEIPARNNPVIKFINVIKRIRKVKKFKKRYNVDTSVSFLQGPNLVNLLSKKNDKVILSIRNFLNQSHSIYGSVNKFLIRHIYKKADHIVSVSKEIEKDLENNFAIPGDKLLTIYNPYDVEHIVSKTKDPLNATEKKYFSEHTLITMGRLHKQKGHWHLIKAFSKVIEAIPDAKLLILGRGELEDYLSNLINNFNLNDSVHLLGFQSNPHKYLSSAQLYVFPSLYEGFPNALNEAMACKLPVISADCPSGPKEILAPSKSLEDKTTDIDYAEYGVLVPELDGKFHEYSSPLTKEEDMLANAIITMLKDAAMREKYSELAFKRVNDFNFEVIMKQWEAII